MKAFVMAAGLGTRLRPLTFYVPKPLVPIANVPVIGHLMKNLSNHGINKIIVNLHHYPQLIHSYLDDGRKWDLEIKYSHEKELLGTAGGMKLLEKHFNDTFIVTSGDGLSDVDFTKLITFHKEKKGVATIALKNMNFKLDYGLVMLDKYAKITNFVEKPSWESVYTSFVNTGIYVFEPEIFQFIPRDTFFDFGSQLLPKLLQKGVRTYGYAMDDYWCDVGNLHEYKRAQHDCLSGKVKVFIPGEQIEPNIWIGKNTVLPKSLKIAPPVVIGEHVQIARNCLIDSFAVIGDRSYLGNSVKIKDSVLWSKVRVKSRVTLDSCIIGQQAVVSESITMFEGAVINIKN